LCNIGPSGTPASSPKPARSGGSIGSKGDSYDNTLAEAVNLTVELISDRGPWHHIDDLEVATLAYVD